jgi:hypothetical protein
VAQEAGSPPIRDRSGRVSGSRRAGSARLFLLTGSERGCRSSWSSRRRGPADGSDVVAVLGFTEKDIKVEIENGVLSISGERKLEKKDEEKNYYRIERSYGKFIRSFTLPANLYGEKILATVNNGLLEIEIPEKRRRSPARSTSK